MGMHGSSGTSRGSKQLSSTCQWMFFWEDQYPCFRASTVGVSRHSHSCGRMKGEEVWAFSRLMYVRRRPVGVGVGMLGMVPRLIPH
jgi:hypothetical protein